MSVNLVRNSALVEIQPPLTNGILHTPGLFMTRLFIQCNSKKNHSRQRFKAADLSQISSAKYIWPVPQFFNSILFLNQRKEAEVKYIFWSDRLAHTSILY